jgi:hypothetical protein
MVSSEKTQPSPGNVHTVWQLAIHTFLLRRLDLPVGILLFTGRLRYLCCAIAVSHSCTELYQEKMSSVWPKSGVACGVGSSPDLEASLLGAAILAVDLGGHNYNSSKEWLQNRGTGLGDEEKTRERRINMQWHTLKT